MLIRDGVVDSPPYGDRSSVGIVPTGALDVRRVEFFGTWKGLGQRRAVNDLNQFPASNGVALFTPSYGPSTPSGPAGTVQAVVFPFPPATANVDHVGPVVSGGGSGATPIHPEAPSSSRAERLRSGSSRRLRSGLPSRSG